MDARHFDTLARALSEASTRRGVLGLLATFPVLGALLSQPDLEDVDAKGRRRRRKKPHHHRKKTGNRAGKQKKRRCKPESKAKTCSGTCGPVKNNCKKSIDCGSCACPEPCEPCFICESSPNTPGTCMPDPEQQGDACGDPGQVCQANGTCACTESSCPACTTCGEDGACQGCSGCCDGQTCVADCGACRTCDDSQCVSCPGCCDSDTCVASCPSCQACDGGQCRSCAALGQLCCADTCVSGECCSHAECSGDTPICDGSHTCVACQTNGECGEGFLCLSDGSCQACTVTCSGTSEECGAALQSAMEEGGTVYVCPGTYQRGFVLSTAVTVVGAGEGDNAADHTILDANQAGSVMVIADQTGTVDLRRLRITGGKISGAESGAGIFHRGTKPRMTETTVTGNTIQSGFGSGISIDSNRTLELTRCTISDNHTGVQGFGGGIFVDGPTTLTDCLVEGNTADFGGGMFLNGGMTTLDGNTRVRDNRADASGTSNGGGISVARAGLVIAATCRVTGNTAPEGGGGGISKSMFGGVTLLGDDDPSPIVIHNCHENCVGNVSTCAPGGTCPPEDTRTRRRRLVSDRSEGKIHGRSTL